MHLADKDARSEALNIHHSYIVQAPAGSGKTALLTQRFLALLSIVESPQEIVALTFTKKAASEMRTRVIEGLSLALKTPPKEPYLLETYRLAQKALVQDKKYDWNLIEQPTQLRIQTIDSLCHYLTSRMPIFSKSIPFSQINEDCSINYENAAKQCIRSALKQPDYKNAAMLFLNHLGNHRQRTIELLTLMLSKRDQWLYPVIRAKHLEREDFDKALRHFKHSCVANINASCDEVFFSTLTKLLQYQHAFTDNPVLKGTTSVDKHDFVFWQSLSQLLLSQNGEFRKRFTIKEGFPPLSYFKTRDEKEKAQSIKTELQTFVERLSDNSNLKKYFYLASLIPLETFNDEQWAILKSMLTLLPLLVAELQLEFSLQSHVDFTEIALQANQCLGEETPTDLTLYLDNQIKHLLIDEFQDTSISQFALLEKLTHGFEKGDGRTLFVVGDPMQSIYRFRQAEVGLFLKAKKEGIGHISLKSLKLTSNFRSSETLIHCVNKICERSFPKSDDMDTGAISYSPSNAIQLDSNTKIKAFSYEDKNAEAQHISKIIKDHPNKSIAILVSSRNQLDILIPALKANNIVTEGVDLQSLRETTLIDTLYHLTLFLLDPLDTLALSALLLSPLCGINYDTLERIITQYDGRLSTLFSTLDDATQHQTILKRLKHMLDVLDYHQASAYRIPLLQRVKKCFYDLKGDMLLSNELEDINAFWAVLGKVSYPVDVTLFKKAINKLYSKNSINSNVHVMTIHKSKGLEFDMVILPSLQYVGRNNHTSLLEWTERLDSHNQRQLLLSPIKSTYEKEDKLYQFIRYLDKEKTSYEKLRLLYVALTRAKNTLYLLSSSFEEAPKGSFLSLLSHTITFEPIKDDTKVADEEKYFERLSESAFDTPFQRVAYEKGYPINHTTDINHARILGIFIHEELYFITKHHIKDYKEINQLQWKSRLIEMGLPKEDVKEATNKASIILKNVFECPRGRWIITPHKQALDEYALSTKEGHFIIDRTFIENNTRWIIDYKTASSSNNIDKQYIRQLENYAHLFHEIEENPVKLGLYYPLEKRFIDWIPGHFKPLKPVEMSATSL